MLQALPSAISTTSLVALQRQELAALERVSTLNAQLADVGAEQATAATAAARQQLAQMRAGVVREHAKAVQAYETARTKRVAAESATTTAVPGVAVPSLDRDLLLGLGLFLLLLPLTIAFARRLWIRHSPKDVSGIDADAAARMRRVEAAVEAIAVEVERIGEAQRFSAQLLLDRLPDKTPPRLTPSPVTPISASPVRRDPTSITPH